MANKAKGQDFKVYIGAVGSGTLVAHATSTGFTSAASPADVSDKDSGLNAEFLADSSLVSRVISVQGFYSDDAARTTLQTNHDAQTADTYFLEFPIMNSSNTTAGTKQFSGIITALDADAGEVSGAMTFSATFQVTNSITIAAEAA